MYQRPGRDEVMYSREVIDEVISRNDIVDVISGYVKLKKNGSSYTGLCPFHNEKSPSFSVSGQRQLYHCFGCGAGGNVITFVMEYENMTFLEAVKMLGERAGVALPQTSMSEEDRKERGIRDRLLEINKIAATYYYRQLRSENGKAGLDYLKKRELSDSTINSFGLGYATQSTGNLYKLLKDKGYDDDILKESGLFTYERGIHEKFWNRVIFPIMDINNKVIGFGGRVMGDAKPKYLNSPETRLFDKSRNLYGLNIARMSRKPNMIICEGYMDVISMHQAGFNNAVAGCGTALTSEQVRLINRYAKEVILAYDADEAGQKAVHKAMQLFKSTDVKIRVPRFTGGKDPDEIIKKLGRDKFKGMLEGASNDTEFSLLEIREKYDLETTQGKIDFVRDALKIIATLQPVEQDLYLTRISSELSIEKSSLKLQLQSLIKNNHRRESKNHFKTIVNDYTRNVTREAYDTGVPHKQTKAENRLLTLLMVYPDCSKLLNDFDSNMLSDGFVKKAYSAILNRINDGLELNLMSFGDTFTDNEYSRLARLINNDCESNDSKAEFNDCLKIIEEEYNKKNSSSPSNMSEDEFRNLFSHLNK